MAWGEQYGGGDEDNSDEDAEEKEAREALSFLKDIAWTRLKAALSTLRMPFWVVAWVPLGIGWTVASGRIFWPDWRFFLAAIVSGPFIAGSALSYNEYCDMLEDRLNPRKSLTALVRGLIRSEYVRRLSIGLGVIGVLFSIILSWKFALLMALCVFLSYLYSGRPFRLKSRPGLDLALNALAIGGILPVAGWSLVKDISSFPFLYLLPIIFTIASLYLPTTVADYNADFNSGINTIAVALRPQKTLILGFVFSVLSSISSVVLGYLNVVHNLRVITALSPFLLAQQFAYWWFFIRQVPPLKTLLTGIVALCTLHGIGVFLFLLYYTGTCQFV